MSEMCRWLIKRQSNLQSNVTMDRREQQNIALGTECVFPTGMFSAGPAQCCLKSLSHTTAQHKSQRQGKFPLSWKQCPSCRRCPRCDRLLCSRRQVNWRNSQFPSCISQLFHTGPASTSSRHHPFSIFLGCAQAARPSSALLSKARMQTHRSCLWYTDGFLLGLQCPRKLCKCRQGLALIFFFSIQILHANERLSFANHLQWIYASVSSICLFLWLSLHMRTLFLPKEVVQSPEGVWQKAVRFSSCFFWFFSVGLLGIHPVFVYVHTVQYIDLCTWGKTTMISQQTQEE